jgi:hypothetical protein
LPDSVSILFPINLRKLLPVYEIRMPHMILIPDAAVAVTDNILFGHPASMLQFRELIQCFTIRGENYLGQRFVSVIYCAIADSQLYDNLPLA